MYWAVAVPAQSPGARTTAERQRALNRLPAMPKVEIRAVNRLRAMTEVEIRALNRLRARITAEIRALARLRARTRVMHPTLPAPGTAKEASGDEPSPGSPEPEPTSQLCASTSTNTSKP